MTIAPLEDVVQIGGGADWVAGKVGEGLANARLALEWTETDWLNTPHVGPHPRDAAINAAREAVAHLTEALGVEAPQDAVDGTRRALEEIGTALLVLERMDGHLPAAPGTKPTGHFEGALRMLERVEGRLRAAIVGFE